MPIPQVEIRDVAGEKDLHRFVLLPWKIYRDQPNWVPPLIREVKNMLRPEKHPFHKHGEVALFLAYREKELVGRIAAIINDRHNEFHEEKTGFFGFFESIDDATVASALLERAAQWVADRGMERLRGPASFSTNEECALLIDGFDTPPYIMMPFNPPYYQGLMEAAGFTKAKDLIAYIHYNHKLPERALRASNRIAQREKVKVRSLDKHRFSEEIDRFTEIYNQAWERNWGFVPMTDEEIHHMAVSLKPVVNEDLILFLERGDDTLGFAMALPDMNQALMHANGRLFPFGLLKILYHARRIRTARCLVLGVLPSHRGKGFDSLLYLTILANAKKHGINEGELSWVLEDNTAIRRPLERFGAKAYKTYRFYERSLV